MGQQGKTWRHLLDVTDLNRIEVDKLLQRGEFYAQKNQQRAPVEQILSGKTVVNLFFENSTRTRTSFEQAALRLGANVINMNVATSSVGKGETLLDTSATLNSMHPDFLVFRHASSGTPLLLSKKIDCPIINAGDGSHAHPSQALLDLLTIKRRKNNIENLKILIAGDILHSRVARSNIHLLTMYHNEVRLCGPTTLLPQSFENFGCKIYHDFEEAIKGVDVVMMLRIQNERINDNLFPSTREFFKFFGLTHSKLKSAKDDVIVMHPGPMNRGVEIDPNLADDKKISTIVEQVEMGVAMRMAILEFLRND